MQLFQKCQVSALLRRPLKYLICKKALRNLLARSGIFALQSDAQTWGFPLKTLLQK